MSPEPILSRAAIAGHPLHPMMIHFPVAALLALVPVDAAFIVGGDPFWARAGLWLAGVGAIGGISSSRCTNEEVYVVQKMVRAAFGNNNIDTCARVCHSPTGYGLKQTFGT